MAEAIHSTIKFPEGQVDTWVNYTVPNNRITTVDWIITGGLTASVQIWLDGIGAGNPDLTVISSINDSDTVPGNWRVVENPDGYMELPPEIVYHFSVVR